MNVNEALLLARRRSGVSQVALAGELKISPAFLSMIECQKKRFPARLLDRLPQGIREPVLEALVSEKEAEIAQLRAGNGHAD